MTAEITDLIIKRASLTDPKAQLAQLEFDLLETARARAKKAGLVAYRRSSREGSYAVPSQSELGVVHDTDLNWATGQPIACSCDAHIRYCIHVGAAFILWQELKELSDEYLMARTIEELGEMLKKEEATDE